MGQATSSKGGFGSTPKLSGPTQKNEEPPQPTAPPPPEPEAETPQPPLEQAQVETWFQELKAEPQTEGQVKALLNYPWQLEEEVIVFQLPNQTMGDSFQKLAEVIRQHLKQKSGRKKIGLDFRINKASQGSTKPYTEAEKWNYLKEKNPALEKLGQRLDLGPQ